MAKEKKYSVSGLLVHRAGNQKILGHGHPNGLSPESSPEHRTVFPDGVQGAGFADEQEFRGRVPMRYI